MKKKTCLILFGLATLAGVCIVIVSAVFILAFNRSDKEEDQNTDDQVKESIENPDTPSMSNENIKVDGIEIESIFDEDINSPAPEKANVNEISLALDTFRILDEKNWNGNEEDIPLDLSDHDQSKLKFYIENETKKKERAIPDDIKSAFTSSKSQEEISNLMKLSRNEYIEYIKAKGTAQKYIDEINNNVLPANSDRLKYTPTDDASSAKTTTGGYTINEEGQLDYSKVNLNLYGYTVYFFADEIVYSQILGPEPPDRQAKVEHWTKARNIAVRYLMYHEMTHVLQRAYVDLHVEDQYKDDKSIQIFAEKTLADVDDQYFWKWGGEDNEVFAKNNNITLSDESQAEGVAFGITTNVYNMSTEQKEAFWNHMFEDVALAWEDMLEIKEITEKNWPTLSVDGTYEILKKGVEGYPNLQERGILLKITHKVGSFPAYIGYFNPTKPEDMPKLWTALKS